ncbi:MAG: hypothetical protein B6D58_02790, partial [candidate division Zixibacteria bacterium 4484_95]
MYIKDFIFKIAIFAFVITTFFSSLADENRWSTNGPTGACVEAINFHPFDNHIIYLGTLDNGVYKSINSGDSWIHLELGNLDRTVQVLAIHPLGPDTIYAGTIRGLFKSTDAGEEWDLVESIGSPQNDYRAFAINPENSNILYAGGPMDVCKSTDGGQSWYEMILPGEW